VGSTCPHPRPAPTDRAATVGTGGIDIGGDRVYPHRMTRAGMVIAVGLIAGVVASSMPSPAVAQQQRGQQGGQQRGQHHEHDREQHRNRRGSDGPRHDNHSSFRHRHHPPRQFVTFYSPPSVVYYTDYAPPPVYYAPPVVYQAPPAYYSAPAMPRVVEYATGRYELRGDGVTTAYQWAWIPNPPSPPPPPVEPASVAPPSAPAPVTPSESREAFRWTDDNGVTTWTDRLDNVPVRFRAQMQRQR
jgi:hypothetical protein